MTPIYQTKFHSDERQGNCFAAAIASILDLPLSSVPEFEEMGKDWHMPLFKWLDSINKDVECLCGQAPAGWAVAGGMGARGVKHAVVVKDGVFVHDPHPSRLFIDSIDEYWVFPDKECMP